MPDYQQTDTLLRKLWDLDNAITALLMALMMLPDTAYELWLEPTEEGRQTYGILPMCLGQFDSKWDADKARYFQWADDPDEEVYRYIVKEVPCARLL